MKKLMFVFASVIAAYFGNSTVQATVTITAASGGSNISADKAANATSPAWTSLGQVVIDEAGGAGGRNDISPTGTGTIVLKAPAGFEFNTAVRPSVTKSGSDITSVTITNTDSTTLTITVAVAGTSNNDTITVGSTTNIQVRPISGSPLATAGNIYRPTTGGGTIVLEGLTTTDNTNGAGGTSFGALSEVAGTVTKLAFTTQPGSATAGANFGTQPVVKTQDQFGNNSAVGLGATLNVTNVLSLGTGSLQGTRTNNIGTGGGNGTITHTNLRLDTTGTNKQLTVTAPGLTTSTSSNFTVNPAAANKLAISTQPSLTATQGVAFAQQPVIQIQDQFGNLRSADTTTVIASRNAGSGVLQGTTSIAAVGGVATFTSLSHGAATNITITFTNAGLTSVTSSVVTVNKADQAINFGALGDKTYGDAAFGVSATTSSGLPVAFSIFSGPATISSGTNVNITGVGTVVVRASQAGNTNYNAASNVDQSFTVAKASLTVAADNKSKPYGSANPTFTVTYTGLVYGDTAAAVSGAADFATLADTNSTVAGSPYLITPSLGTLSAANYDFTSFVAGELSVTPATITVTANDTNRVYGASNPTFTASYSGFVNGEDESVISGSPSLTTTADETSGAGSHTITAAVGDLAAANYSFAFVNGTLSVTKAALTVTAENKSKTYGAANPTFTTTYSGLLNGDTAAVVSGAADFTTLADTNSTVAGSPYAITPSLGTLSAANYDFTGFVVGELSVTQATITVTANNTNRFYGAANPTLTASFSGFVNGEEESVISGSPSLTNTADETSVVGNYNIVTTAGTLSAANYNFAVVNGTLSVTPATITVTAHNTNRVYGASNPTFTASYSGFVNGEEESVISGSPSLTTTADETSGAGNHTITAVAGNLAAPNYSFAFANGTLTVTKAALIAAADNKSKTFGSANPTFTLSYTGLINGDTAAVVTGTADFATLADTNSTVAGSPYSITPSLGTLSAANYDFTSFVAGELTVTPATITVTANNTNRVYGASNPTFTASYSGFANGEDESVISGSPSLTTISDETSGAGSHTITTAVGTLAAANYSFAVVNGTLSVMPATITVTANDTNRIYGASNPAFTASYSGFVNGQDESVISGSPSLTTSADETSGVGEYDIVTAAGTLAADNYDFAFVSGTLTVTKAALAVTADNKIKTYGSANPGFTVSYIGLLNGETPAVVTGAPDFATSADTNSTVAGSPYSIVPSVGTLATANYDFTSFVAGELSVTPATITVTANDTNRIYGASNPAFTASYSGFVNGQDESVISGSPDLTTTADETSAVGGHTITAAVGTLSAANYSFSYVNGTLTITKAGLTVTAENKSKIYGSANPTFTATYSGFLNGDNESVLSGAPDFATIADTNSTVAGTPYAIVPSVGTLAAVNYDFTSFVAGTLSVTPATITVTADDTNRVYGVSNPAFTASYSGFVNSQDESVISGSPSLTTSADEASTVGSYDIGTSAGTLSAANYSFSYVDGILTITKAGLTVTAENKAKIYGSANPTFTASYSGFLNGDNESVLSGAPDFATTADTNSTVAGSPYSIAPSVGTLAAVNYDLTSFVAGTLSVTPATITVTADDTNRVYGVSNPAFTASYSGFVNSQDESVISGSPSLTTSADEASTVGSYDIGTSAGTLSAANYSFSYVDGILTITKAGLTVTAENKAKIYGSANPTFTASYSGFLNGDNESVLSGAPDFSTLADTNSTVAGSPYSIVPSVGTLAAANYAFTSFVAGTLSVTPATITVTANDTNRIYGASNPAFTASYSGFMNNQDESVIGGSPSLTTSADEASTVGSYDIVTSAGTLSAANYSFSYVNGTLTITKAGLTVTAENKSKIYGSVNPAFTASYSGFVNGDTASVLTGSPSLMTSADELSGVIGSPYPIVAAFGTLSADNYSFNFVNGELSVTKATLTVTADDKSKIYGSANPTLTASFDGFVNGENETVLSGTPYLTTVADEASGVVGSPYAIVAAAGTLASDNYAFSFVDGILTVTPAVLTGTAHDTNRVYGVSNPVFTGSIVGLQNSDNVTATYSTSADESSAVGTFAIVPSLNDPDGKLPNYTVTINNGTLTVTKSVLTVTADNQSKIYGSANPTFTASYTGFVDGDNESVLSGSPSLTTAANETSGVVGSPYLIVAAPGTLSAANYSFNFVDGQLTVTKAVLTVLADNKSRSYGATNPIFTASYDGFVNGESDGVLEGAPDYSTSATTNSSVAGSPYPIIISAGTLAADNYSFGFVDGSLVVTKATLTITADNKSKAFGASVPVLTFSYSGFVNAEESSVLSGSPEISTTATANSSVAGAPYVISISPGTLSADNYAFAFVNGELAVMSAILTVTADNKSKIYGTANPTFTASYTGFLAGDDEGVLSGSPSLTSIANESSAVAGSPYPIVAALGTLSAANYSFDFVDGALSVTAAGLIITSDSTNRVYGATDPTFTGGITGLQNGDDITATYVSVATAASAVGGYPITQDLSDPNGKLSNYSVTTNNGTLTVTVAGLSVTPDGKVRPLGQENPAFTGVITGIQNSDDITATYSTEADTNSPAGTYAIVPEWVDPQGKLGNYSVTTNHGTLTVYDKPVISIQPLGLTTNQGATVSFSVSATGVAPLIYQWRKVTNELVDGGMISGATTPILTLTGVSVADSGDYNVVVSNDAGSVTSSNAALIVIELPVILSQPTNIQVLQGQNAAFSVVASGGGLAYQWYFGALPIDGATTSTLTISNAQPINTGSGYIVVISNEVGSVTSAPSAFLTLVTDFDLPKITITSPKKNKGTDQAAINVTGVAKDKKISGVTPVGSGIIKSVHFIHNGTNYSAGLTDISSGPALGTWGFNSTNPITLTPGTNTLEAWATDLAGNESEHDSFVFYYDLTNTLTLNIVGNGEVKMKQELWSGSQTLIPNVFKVGRPYKLDAFVGKGTNYVFTGWTTTPGNVGSSTNKWVQKAGLPFVMQENMVINVNFSTNPFTPVVGSYNGLFSDTTNGVSHESAGFFQVKVKDKSSYSGYLFFDGMKRPFSGKFATDGTVTRDVLRTKLPVQATVQLSLALDMDGESIGGTVTTNGAWISTIIADKAVFSVSNLETTNVGQYTLQIPTGLGAPQDSPGGVGYGAVTNSSLGIVKLSGLLSDGEKLGQKINLSRDGLWPMYLPLYKNSAKEYKGMLMGWVTFTGSTNAPTGSVTWIKKNGSQATTYYPAGFSNDIMLAASPYVMPALNELPISLSVGDRFIVSDGNLITPFTNIVSAISGSKITLSRTNTLGVENKATLVFKAKDGTFTGGFLRPTVKTKTQGVVLQNSNAAAGFFQGASQSGTVRAEDN